jgi:hypothetical protein
LKRGLTGERTYDVRAMEPDFDNDQSRTLVRLLDDVSSLARAASLVRETGENRDALVRVLSMSDTVRQLIRESRDAALDSVVAFRTMANLTALANDLRSLFDRKPSRGQVLFTKVDASVVAILADSRLLILGALSDPQCERCLAVPSDSPAQILKDIADEYGQDARRQSRTVTIMFGLAFAMLAGAAALVLYQFSEIKESEDFSAGRYLAQSWLPITLVAFASYLIYQTGLHRRSADEARRLQRQLRSFDAYISPLPKRAQDLMRGTMVQRLFPRLIEDNDPLREVEQFPQSVELLATIDPEHFRLAEESED